MPKFNVFFNFTERKLIMRALLYVKPYKIKFIFAVCFTLIALCLSTIQPLIFGQIIDLITANKISTIYIYIIIIFLLMSCEGVLTLIENYFITYIANKIVFDLRIDLYENILNFPIKTFDEMKKGEFISRFESDINSLADILSARLSDFIIDIFRLIFIGIIVFKINFNMALFLLIAFPISYLISYIYGKKIHNQTVVVRHLSEKYLSFLQESLIGIKEIRQLMLEKIMSKKMVFVQEDYCSKNINKNMTRETAKLVNLLFSAVIFASLIYLGTKNISNGILTLGSFVAFNNYSSRFHISLHSVTRLYTYMQETLVSIKRIFELIDNIRYKNTTPRGEKTIDNLYGNIKLNNISFSYNDGMNVLENVSINLVPNNINTIIGPSGVGKSTIVKLIMGFYTPTSGDISVDDVKLAELSQEFLNNVMAYIPQEPFLFNVSVKENLLYAKEGATDEEIIDVCQKVGLHEYIYSLDNKYDTLVNEMGNNFSTGQKQRLAIARAILKQPKILLLDEPTSSLDGESKKNIMELLNQLKNNRTIILVTHDEELIKNSNNTILLDKANIKYFNDFNSKVLEN